MSIIINPTGATQCGVGIPMGTMVTATDSDPTSTASWMWVWGDGEITPSEYTAFSATHVYNTAGVFTMYLERQGATQTALVYVQDMSGSIPQQVISQPSPGYACTPDELWGGDQLSVSPAAA